MPLRVLITALSLIVLVLLIAFVGHAIGSEYYFALPSRRGGIREPPTSPWTIVFFIAQPIVLFFISRKYAAILMAGLAVFSLLGMTFGLVFFEWAPGIAQYLLILSLGALAAYVWSHDCLNED